MNFEELKTKADEIDKDVLKNDEQKKNEMLALIDELDADEETKNKHKEDTIRHYTNQGGLFNSNRDQRMRQHYIDEYKKITGQ